MFPLSSIYQQSPGQNASKINEHDYDENPSSSNGQDQHDDTHDHHHQVYASYLPYSSLPAIFEDDGMLLSHLLYSQEQQILAGNSTTSHTNSQAHTDEISVVASNQAVLDHHYHHHHHHYDHQINPSSTHENPSKVGFSKKQRAKVVQAKIPRRRTGKKDRHSKISTAQGLRDRRMRISLQIARKFFDLQDMLGFDKASKTIEWLISKSRTAIKELKAKQSSSSTSEGEVVSKTAKKLEDVDDDDDDRNDEPSIRMRKEKKTKKLHKVIARESREKARERARERTRERILEKSRKSSTTTTSTEDANNIDNTSTGDLGKSRPNSSLKMVASSFDQDQLPRDADQLLDHSISDHIGLSISGANSKDDFLGFPGNWENDNIIDSSSKSQSFCRSTVANTKSGFVGNVRAPTPCSIFTTTLSSDTEEQEPYSSFFPVATATSVAAHRQKPTSIFVTTSSDNHFEENPSSVFIDTNSTGRNYAAEEQNPRPVFVTTSNVVHQEQNPSSNFFLAGLGSRTAITSIKMRTMMMFLAGTESSCSSLYKGVARAPESLLSPQY